MKNTESTQERKIVRCKAGVFFGRIASQEGNAVVMTEARRIWYWAGAASLSQLAMEGTSRPGECKFPVAVTRVELFDISEILSVTAAAAASIDAVKIWTA